MSKASAVSAIERGDLSELQHVLEESEWDIGSEPLDSKGQTALHIACTNGQLDIVQYLVENDENDSAKRTATGLLLSLTNKKCNVAEYLLSKTSEYFPYYAKEVIHSNKLIPQLENEILLVSCAMGYFEVVKFLFKVVSGNVLDDYIQSAYANEHWDILMYLKVKKGDSDFSDVSPPHLTPLQLEVAWRNEQFQAVIALLELTQKRDAHLSLGLSPTGISQLVETVHSAKGAYDVARGLRIKTKVIKFEEYVINIAYSKGYTEVFKFLCTTNQTGFLKTIPLCRKSLRIFQYLITHKISVSMSDVHVACIMGDVKKLKVALESNGPSILCIADPSGNLAIHYAVYEPGVLSTILNAIGNDLQILNAKNYSGETPLHHCIIACCSESLDLLIEFPSCDVNLSNYKGETPLHIACNKINISAIQVLVADERCDLNIPNSIGDTPLHIAACSKSESAQMMQCLLQSGRCDCNLTDRRQRTALHIACKEMNIRGVEILVADESCKLNIHDSNGDTPLHIAACSKSESAQMMQCLLQSGRCDCNLKDRRQRTALHIACKEMNIRGVEILVADESCKLNIHDSNGDTPLHIAACSKSESAQMMQCLLQSGRCDCNLTDRQQRTALHIACEQMNSRGVKILVADESCELNIPGNNGDTPLHIAACSKSKGAQMMQCLLQSGRCDCNLTDRRQCTALHIACREMNIRGVEVLAADQRCDLNIPNSNRDTPLHIAACGKSKGAQMMQCLLQSGRCDCNLKDRQHSTPLHIVCKQMNIRGVEVLVADKGCDLNIPDSNGDTPLHIAACSKSESAQMMQCLLQSGRCDCNLTDRRQCTALHIACREMNIRGVEVLAADQRCDLNIPNSNRDTPLHIAACSKSKGAQMMQCLLQSGRCDCNLKDRQHSTPLHIVCKQMNIRGVEVLVADKGCDLNIPDSNGDAPLHIAAYSERESAQMMQCLLQSGRCDCNLKDRQHCTPLHIVCKQMNIRGVEVLIADKGCDLNIPDSVGDAPIHIACGKSSLEVIELLLGCRNCNPNQQNTSGDTTLHIVCKMRLPLKLIKTLISTPGIDPGIVNHNGLTPIEEAGTNYAAIDAIKKFLVHKNSSIQGYLKIFVVGKLERVHLLRQ